MKGKINFIVKENNYYKCNYAISACKDKIENNSINAKKEKLSNIIKCFKNKKYKNYHPIKSIPKNFPTIKKTNNLLLIIILILFSPFIINKEINNNNFAKLNSLWEISLTIQGTGNQNILCDQDVKGYTFTNTPNEVKVNGNDHSNSGYIVNDLTDEINEITLIWYSSFTNCNVMFYGLTNILKVDLSKFDSSNVKNVLKMFQGCTSLTSINFNNFNAASITEMRDLFAECSSLQSLDLSSFITSSATKMDNIFYCCSSLTTLNLNNFDTSKVVSMSQMFYGCSNVTSLDLNNFVTSSVENMNSMFKDCKSLRYLNIKSFDTSKVTNMNRMFMSCNSLTSLDITNLVTSSVKNMERLFYNCKKLTTLDLSNFDTSSVTIMSSMFYGCSSLNSLNLNNFITSAVENMMLMFSNCKNLETLNIDYFDTSKVSNMFSMFSNCKSLISLNLSSFKTTKAKNFTYMFENINQNILYCIDETKIPKIINQLSSTYPNYNNNCSDICFSDKRIIIVDKKCIYDCSNNDINTLEYNYFCKSDKVKEEDIPKNEEDIPKNEEDIICSPYDFFVNNCNINSNEQNEINKIIELIRNEILTESMNSLIYNIFNDDKKDFSIRDNNAIYQLTSSDNQKNYNHSNISTIKLGDCEKELKKYYNIDENDPLLIFKVDLIESNQSPLVEYEVYDYKEKKKLNLSICKDIPIEIDIPISLDTNELFKYNLSSEYYKDRCFPYTTEKGADIILDDRKNEYFQNHMSVCEENCQFDDYDYNNKKAKCKCQVKETFMPKQEFKIDKDKFMKLLNIKNTINIYVMKCYKLFLSKNGIKKNIGNYILLAIILLNIVLLLFFIFKEYNLLNIKIQNLINENKIERKKSKKQKKKKMSIMSINKRNTIKNSNTHKKFSKERSKVYYNPPRLKMKNSSQSINESRTNEFISGKSKRIFKIEDNNIKIFDKNEKFLKKDIKYNDYEINRLNYKEALILDKRTYLEYYISLLKRKQILIFTFYIKDDYNSKILKISLLLFSFSLYYTVNALFFVDSTVHDIYEKDGSFDFIYQLPQIIYSSIISAIISTIINFLSLTEKNILRIKTAKEKNDENIMRITIEVKKCILIKIFLFFLFNFIGLICFWYYLGCFCAVYKNTQVHLFKDSIFSFILSLLYPFALCFLPGILRIPALNAQKQDKECIYKLSKFLQLI